jgi:4-hydroxy-tetrahydrodipicolinate reductase
LTRRAYLFIIRAHVHIASRSVSGAPVRVAVCGLGSIGRKVAQLLLDHRDGAEVVAAATLDEADIGRPLPEVAGAQRGSGPIVVGSLADLLESSPDVVVYCTGSFLRDCAEDVIAIAGRGANVISPCEELAFPFNRFPEPALRIDAAAREAGVTVVGSGVNPGFIFDSLLAAATGVSWDVPAIRGRRVVDVSGFGQNIHFRLGIGYTREEFERGHADGTIAGHVGFPESIEMICERLGLPLDGPVEEVFEPLVAETAAPARYGEVAAGRTEGFVQRATGPVAGEPRVRLELVLHLRPRASGFEPADTIEIDGVHPVRLTIAPGMDAILATSAELVNGIPGLLKAPPGLKSVKDLPAAAAWLGDPRGAALR